MISQLGVGIPGAPLKRLEFGQFVFGFPQIVTARELELARDLVNIYLDQAIAELKRREASNANPTSERRS